MLKLSKYNLPKLIFYFCTIGIIGGCLIGAVNLLIEIDLFKANGGILGFMVISLIVAIAVYYLDKYESWFTT